MNVVLAVNERAVEKYVTNMKECNVLKVLRSRKLVLKEIIDLNPHLLILSGTLPGKENMEELIISLRDKQPHTRIVYLYGNDDNLRRKFANFLIKNKVYDFHIGAIDEDILTELILYPKTSNDVKLEELSEDEEVKLKEEQKMKEEFLNQLRESIKNEIKEEVSLGDTDLSEDEIEYKIEERVIKEAVKELEVHIIDKIEEIEKVVEVEKVIRETIVKTKLIKQKTYAVMSLYNTSLKDSFISSIADLISSKAKQKILLIDFESPFPTIDHHFNIDKCIYINELHNSKKLTGVSGCISAIKKNMLSNTTFHQFVKKVKGYDNLDILTGLYDIDEFDRVDISDVEKIIECAKNCYDNVIISTNSFIQNSFTYSAITNSTNVILVSENTYVNARANIKLIKEFTEYHQQNIDKFSIVLYGDYISDETQEKLYEGYNLIGNIDFNEKYLLSIANKEIYVKKYANKKEIQQYYKVLSNLGYIPKPRRFNIPFLNSKEGV